MESATSSLCGCDAVPSSFPPSRRRSSGQCLTLQALSDIEIAMQILKDDAKEQKEHPADRHYSALKCSLDAIEHDDDEFLVSLALAKIPWVSRVINLMR